jgi:hypothetical protein
MAKAMKWMDGSSGAFRPCLPLQRFDTESHPRHAGTERVEVLFGMERIKKVTASNPSPAIQTVFTRIDNTPFLALRYRR